MNEIMHSIEPERIADDAEDAILERRLFRAMCVAIALAVIASTVFASWRVTTGLLLGGVLSLFNHHWLRTSVMEIVSGAAMPAKRMRWRIAARFVLRYFIVASIVCAAALLHLISIPATLVGLSAFVAALMIEASVQMYAAIVHRERF